MSAVHIPGITAPPSTAYKIVDVPETAYHEPAKPAFPILSEHNSLAISRGEQQR